MFHVNKDIPIVGCIWLAGIGCVFKSPMHSNIIYLYIKSWHIGKAFDWWGVRFLLEGMKYFKFYNYSRSGNQTKHGVDLWDSICNVLKIGRCTKHGVLTHCTYLAAGIYKINGDKKRKKGLLINNKKMQFSYNFKQSLSHFVV